MKPQTAAVLIKAQALVGVHLLVNGTRGDKVPLENGHDALHNLRPGDTITITVESDDRWLAHQETLDKAEAAKAAQTDDVDHRAKAEAKAEADTLPPPDANAGVGDVVTDTGATRTRTTRR